MQRVGELIASHGAEVRYLQPYSPDLNPIVCVTQGTVLTWDNGSAGIVDVVA